MWSFRLCESCCGRPTHLLYADSGALSSGNPNDLLCCDRYTVGLHHERIQVDMQQFERALHHAGLTRESAQTLSAVELYSGHLEPIRIGIYSR